MASTSGVARRASATKVAECLTKCLTTAVTNERFPRTFTDGRSSLGTRFLVAGFD